MADRDQVRLKATREVPRPRREIVQGEHQLRNHGVFSVEIDVCGDLCLHFPYGGIFFNSSSLQEYVDELQAIADVMRENGR